eukprot:GDKJ01019416.1.p1 GENE.GDKJ01019416.1~~GDKJ01019416.1.p1  ORF type:complete len:455 (-),score=57.18 GDKJ01019416.1:162-1526(-)
MFFLFFLSSFIIFLQRKRNSINNQQKKIAIFHLDLGIGGAEQLMIHIANSMVDLEFQTTIYTSHFDPNRCFPQALERRFNVQVFGSWLPRTVFGRFHVLCAYIKMIYCALAVLFSGEKVLWSINDQVPIINPILFLFSRNVLFYCHFPDKLLCVDRSSLLKRLYRAPFDFLEEVTTIISSVVVMNSNYTMSIVEKHLPLVKRFSRTCVIYPPVDLKITEGYKTLSWTTVLSTEKEEVQTSILSILFSAKNAKMLPYVISLNRYERKKEVQNAIYAYHDFLQKHPQSDMRLVIAGGFDNRVEENVSYYRDLNEIAFKKLKLDSKKVCFLRSISESLRWLLLRDAEALLYTPKNEHFGMVPCEAMAMGTPVVASNAEGGPRESIACMRHMNQEKDGSKLWERATGVLVGDQEWGAGLDEILMQKIDSQACAQRVRRLFSLQEFTRRLDEIMKIKTA